MIHGQGQDTEWEYFWDRKISNTFFGLPDIPGTFLGVNRRCWVQAYV